MTRVDLHPEDLFDHLRRGELRDDERQRLERHCAVCSACAFELQLVQASDHDAAPSAADHAIAARAMERMWSGDAVSADENNSLDQDPTDAEPMRIPVRSHAAFRAAALLLAGVLVGGSVSAAALTGGSPFVLVELITGWVNPSKDAATQATNHTAPTHVTPRRKAVANTAHVDHALAAMESPTVESPTVEATPIATPEGSVTSESPTPTSLRAVIATRRNALEPPIAGGPAPVPPVEPAAWLFRAASRARSAGRYQEAAALYGVLQRDYAGSETEVVARVALGRLWLGQLNDATQALNAFDSYLNARPTGPLAEEARSGRVLALRKLGRDEAAQAALRDLLEHHPRTLYAKPVTSTP